MHYRIYKFRKGAFLYDRTLSTEREAEDFVYAKQRLGFIYVWSLTLIPGAYY
jgi:hypothetical protein